MSPTATDRIPTVFILTPKHADGLVHAINLRYLTPIQQQQLQYYFKTPQERQQQTINPFQQQHDHQTMTLRQQLNQNRFARPGQQQPQQKQDEVQGVVVKPDPKNIFGVSTFTRTSKAIVDVARNAFGKVLRYIPFGGNRQPPQQPQQQPPPSFLSGLPQANIDNANSFYYGFVKPLFGQNTKRVYRTYKQEFIQNERIIKLR